MALQASTPLIDDQNASPIPTIETTATTAAPQGAPRPETTNAESRMSLKDLANMYPVTSGLSQEATAYLKRLTEIFDEYRVQGKGNIKLTPLTTPAGVIIAELGNKVCPILMQEALGVPNNLPTPIVLRDAMQAYQKYNRAGGVFDTAPSIVVTPSDYGKVEVMGPHLNAILSSDPVANPITASIMQGDQLMLTVNNRECMQFVERCSPHGIPARHDLSFKLSVMPKGQNYQNRNDLFGQYRSDATDIAVVTAYVEIQTGPIDPMTGIPKFTPVIHITDVVSKIQDVRMYIMLVALAAEVFIRAEHWKNQFTHFSQTEPNLGALMMDPNTKDLMFLSSPQELDSFIRTYLTAPIMVLDITDGRARIAGTELFTLQDKDARAALRRAYEGIFTTVNNTTLPAGVEPCALFGYEFTGLVPLNGQLRDTRWIDYLALAVNYKQDKQTIAQFLTRFQNGKPQERFELMTKFYPEAKALYSNNMVFLDLGFIQAIQNEMRGFVQLAPNSFAPNSVAMDLRGAILGSQTYLGAAAGFAVGGLGGYSANTTLVSDFYRSGW